MMILRTTALITWKRLSQVAFLLAMLCGVLAPAGAMASEMDLVIPEINTSYSLFGTSVSGVNLLYAGIVVCLLGMAFGLMMFNQVRKMPASTMACIAAFGRARSTSADVAFSRSTGSIRSTTSKRPAVTAGAMITPPQTDMFSVRQLPQCAI